MSNTENTPAAAAAAADITAVPEAEEPVYFTVVAPGSVQLLSDEPIGGIAPVFYLAPAFYHPSFCPEIPAGAKEITEARWMELRALNAEGHTIEPDANGYPVAVPPPPPTLEQRKAALLAAVDRVLNAAAQKKGYDSITTASLRAAYPGPFHAEGVAFASWMDGCYAKCYEVLAKVKAGKLPEPDEAALLAMLPALELPQ